MSDIGLNITVLDLVRMFAAWAFLDAALPVLLVALLIFLIPSWRRTRAARRFAYGLLGVIAILGATGAPGVLYEADRTLGPLFRRMELTEPRLVDGMAFPAGTKLQLNKQGEVESGTLPSPTPIQGLLLTGNFKVEHSAFAKPRVWAATLARAAEIEGIPCAEGPFEQPDAVSPQILKCRLAKDFDFLGYPLAAGSRIELYPARAPSRLQHGVLRTSLILFDVEWPAGTAVDVETAAAELRHGPIADRSARLCVPAGATVMIGGAEVHGAVEILTGGTRISLWSDAAVIAEHCPDAGSPGYLLRNGERETHLEIPRPSENRWRGQ
jgi:hypothetical protein